MDKLVIDENYDVNELQASTLKWKEIWNKREIKYGDDKLLSLIRLDGFDHSEGGQQPSLWFMRGLSVLSCRVEKERDGKRAK